MPRQSPGGWILLIAIFKLVKGLLLLAAGIGALKLLHKDVSEVVGGWIDVLRIDPGNRYVHALLAKVPLVSDRTLKEISAGTFAYASVFLTEGTGLLLRKRWAEYFTIIVTTSFLPLEVYELARHVTVAKFGVILVNMAIVAYLISNVRSDHHGPKGRSPEQNGQTKTAASDSDTIK